MWFCPIDGTLLLIGKTPPNRNRYFSSDHHQQHSNNNNNNENYFYCMTCPYTCPVAAQQEQQQRSLNNKNHNIPTSSMIHKKRMTVVSDLSNLNQYGKRRMMGNNNNKNDTAADLDILGGKSAWENVDRTTIFCSKCSQQVLAYFVQIQIRSADEPMTIFYKCSKCSFQWNE